MSVDQFRFGPEEIDGFVIEGFNYHPETADSMWHITYWSSQSGKGNVANYIVQGEVFKESVTSLMDNGMLQFRPRYTGESNVPAIQKAAVLKAISKWMSK